MKMSNQDKIQLLATVLRGFDERKHDKRFVDYEGMARVVLKAQLDINTTCDEGALAALDNVFFDCRKMNERLNATMARAEISQVA